MTSAKNSIDAQSLLCMHCSNVCVERNVLLFETLQNVFVLQFTGDSNAYICSNQKW